MAPRTAGTRGARRESADAEQAEPSAQQEKKRRRSAVSADPPAEVETEPPIAKDKKQTRRGRAVKGEPAAVETEQPVVKAGKRKSKEAASKGAVDASDSPAPKGAQRDPSKEQAEAKQWKQREGLPRKWKNKESAEDWRRRELEQRNCSKYHMLKFVERQKVERKLRSCRRSLQIAIEGGDAEAAQSLREQLRVHLADHEYIDHYPKHLPYNSLFPKVDSEASQARREEVRKLIRSTLEKEQAAAESKEQADGSDLDDDDFFEQKKQELRSGRDKTSAEQREGGRGRARGQRGRGAKQQDPTEAPSKKERVRPAEQDYTPDDEKAPKRKRAKKQEAPYTARRKRTKVTEADPEDARHPSWAARQSPKLTGALQKGSFVSQPVVFDSDIDIE